MQYQLYHALLVHRSCYINTFEEIISDPVPILSDCRSTFYWQKFISKHKMHQSSIYYIDLLHKLQVGHNSYNAYESTQGHYYCMKVLDLVGIQHFLCMHAHSHAHTETTTALTTGAIAGISIGVILVAILIISCLVGICCCYLCRRSWSKTTTPSRPARPPPASTVTLQQLYTGNEPSATGYPSQPPPIPGIVATALSFILIRVTCALISLVISLLV